MRERMVKVKAPADAIDTCGTGGDASGTFNISTAAALVVAACGVPVAKHGNRALSSRAGSADVLAALGVNIDAEVSHVERRDRGGRHRLHDGAAPSWRDAPRRRRQGRARHAHDLQPAGAACPIPPARRRQLMGVFATDWVEPMAHVLGQLGSERAWVVHGSDGLDEITTTGPTQVAELRDGKVRCFEVTPEQAGLPKARLEDLRGADAETNAAGDARRC